MQLNLEGLRGVRTLQRGDIHSGYYALCVVLWAFMHKLYFINKAQCPSRCPISLFVCWNTLLLIPQLIKLVTENFFFVIVVFT